MTDKVKSLSLNQKALIDSIDGLRELEDAKLKTANRRDIILYGSLLGFYAALGLLLIFGTKNQGDALYILAIMMWVGIVLFLNRQMNEQRFILNMQFGLQKIERSELKKALEADPTPVIKAVKAVKKATK